MYATIGMPGRASTAFVEQFKGYVERWVSRQQSQAASVPAESPGPGRPCELPAEVLWSTLLLSVLQRVRGVRDVWRALVCQGYDICDQAVYARLDRSGTEPLQALFEQVSRMLAAWVQPLVNAQSWEALAPFARAVLALDETTLDPLARKLPSLRHFKKGAVELLPGKLATLFDVRLQLWQRIDYLADAQQNCKVPARVMLAGLRAGTLLLFDLGYFGFEWLDELTTRSLWYVSRLREKTSYAVVHTLYESNEVFDGLVWLGTHQAKARSVARLVRVRVGCCTHEYLTNVLDPSVLPVGDLVRLYARRWDIELAFLLLKEYLELHLWWNSKLTGILQQLWACLIIAQLLQAMRMEIACQAHVDPFEVSMPLVVRSMPMLLGSAQAPIALCVQRGRQLGYIRPSSRLQLQVPVIAAADIVPRPVDLVLQRTPCYPADPGRPGRKSSNSRHKPKTGPPFWQALDIYEFIAQ
jgi:Transposase DDE domain